MYVTPLRAYGPFKNINVLAMGCNNIGHIITSLGVRNKSGKEDKCCPAVSQTEGRKVEPWPKPEEPAPCWRPECFGREPQPPNYDPYRIKVPEVVVPPLPPTNVKEVPSEDCRDLFRSLHKHPRELYYNSPTLQPDYWRGKLEKPAPTEKCALAKLGYHGRNKLKYAFHEPWKPLDRVALLEQAEKDEVDVSEGVVAKSS